MLLLRVPIFLLLCKCFNPVEAFINEDSVSQPIRLKPQAKKNAEPRLAKHSQAAPSHPHGGNRKLHQNHQNQLHQQQKPLELEIKLNITEPPNGSYVYGDSFFVALGVEANDKSGVNEKAQVCLSLDEGPFICWSMKERILYAGCIEGEHSLVANFFDGKQLMSVSDVVEFTTVLDPQFEPGADMGDIDPFNQSMEDLEGEFNETLDGSPEEPVIVKFPPVEIKNPADLVSYVGRSLEISTDFLGVQDMELFQKYFHFVCINIDLSTAYACGPLSKDTSPRLVMGLETGMHTVTAAILHPESRDILHDSTSGLVTFFMVQGDSKGTSFVAEVNMRGKVQRIPVARGGSIERQTEYVCNSLGMAEQPICIDPIHHHLKLLSQQIFFI